MNWLKKKVVIGLESVCELTGHRWCHHFATWSIKLDQRWNTGLWREVREGEKTREH